MSGVFVSYRRADRAWAGRLADHLNIRFGKDLIWRDVEDIKPGKKWLEEILNAITTADVILVVIGPNWLQDEGGRRRLDNPNDVLLLEIEAAFESNRGVIPVLVGNIPMPDRADLPPSIRKLLDIQGAVLRDREWAQDIQTLIDTLRDFISKKREPQPLPELHQKLNKMQLDYFSALTSNPQKALTLTKQVLDLLDEQMPHYPNDQYLQIFRGYFLKNEAMALRNLGNHEQFLTKLTEVDQYFRTVLVENKRLFASTLNGIGSVEALRGQYSEALNWIDRALEIEPDYEAAKHDRQTVMHYLSETKT